MLKKQKTKTLSRGRQLKNRCRDNPSIRVGTQSLQINCKVVGKGIQRKKWTM